jgi:hypothetical protein
MHGYLETVTSTHRCKEKWHAATTICALAKCVINLPWGDDRLVIRRAHPVHGGADFVIGDVHAMADDHGAGLP